MSNKQRAGLRIPVKFPMEVRWKNRWGRSRHVQGKTGNIFQRPIDNPSAGACGGGRWAWRTCGAET